MLKFVSPKTFICGVVSKKPVWIDSRNLVHGANDFLIDYDELHRLAREASLDCFTGLRGGITFRSPEPSLANCTNYDVATCYVQTDDINFISSKDETSAVIANKKRVSDICTQTENLAITDNDTKEESSSFKNVDVPNASAWELNDDNNDKGKSLEEQVKKVAQSALEESGMVFVESAGMYYDYKTGYYYNSELGLYYHTDTDCYYQYSHEIQNFVFHSYPDRSVEIENAPLIKHMLKKARKQKKETEEDAMEESSKEQRKKGAKKKEKDAGKKNVKSKTDDKVEPKTDINVTNDKVKDIQNSKVPIKEQKEIKKEDYEMEDGECSESDCEIIQTEVEEDAESVNSTSTATDDESVAKHHPPCMRLIVRETDVSKLKVGSLFIITKDGGTIGREGGEHAIIIEDTNVSRNHLDIRYNLQRDLYLATDLGSKNGTILNGNRMSASQDISTPMEVVHGSVIQLGETKLLCHIHSGNETCGHCEPGLLLGSEDKIAYTRTCNVQKQHYLELARLKNKYSKPPLAIAHEAYNDRAKARRDTVGSSHPAEKTQTSDINSFIPAENKGFKLLEKMGWSKGEGLGKDNQGDKEPIALVSNENKAGLGATSSKSSCHAPSSNLGSATLRLASRTKMLLPPAKEFQDPLDYDSE